MTKQLSFNELPDSAILRIPVVTQLTGVSRSGLYAKSRQMKMPPIVKIGDGRSSGCRVGEVRRYLSDPATYTAPS